jgi:myo-inositol-hexaphosphate 3-phosphohydrolase
VDDALGYVYYADEADGIHKWYADPDHLNAGRELAHFAPKGFRGDREGIAIYAVSDDPGYIVCTEQLDEVRSAAMLTSPGSPGPPPLSASSSGRLRS